MTFLSLKIVIKQWGVANGIESFNLPRYNFPIAFPNTCYQVVTNRKANNPKAAYGNLAGACDWDKTQISLYSDDRDVPVNYIAIGI